MKTKKRSYDLIHIHPAALRAAPGFMFIPAGLFGVLNEVRSAGYRLLLVNEPLELSIDSSFSIYRFLRQNPAACYSIDIHWHEHLYGGVSVARIIKRLYPESVIIVGGLTSSFYDREMLDLCPEIDFLISGYGEGCLLPIVENVCRNGKPPHTSLVVKSDIMPDIDRLDLTTRDFLLHHEQYLQCSVHFWDAEKNATTFWLKNGFGCKKNCPFCGGSQFTQKLIFGNNAVVYRSPHRLSEDLLRLDQEGVQMISLTHDTSITGSAYWKQLHRILRAEKRKCGVYIEAEALPGQRFLEDFSRTFDLERTVIALSPLCHNEILRSRHGKQFDNHRFWQCLHDLDRLNIRFALYFIASLFDHDPTSRSEESKFQAAIKASFKPIFMFNSFLTLDPGSPMYVHPEHHDVELSLRGLEDYWKRCKQRSQNMEYDKFGYVQLAIRERN